MKNKLAFALLIAMALVCIFTLVACDPVQHNGVPAEKQELADYLELIQTSKNYSLRLEAEVKEGYDVSEVLELFYTENALYFSIYAEGYGDESFMTIIIEYLPEEDIINGYLGCEYGWTKSSMENQAESLRRYAEGFAAIGSYKEYEEFFNVDNYTYDEENGRFIFDVLKIYEDDGIYFTTEIYVVVGEDSFTITTETDYDTYKTTTSVTYYDFGTTVIEEFPDAGAILPMPEGDLQESLDKLEGANMTGTGNVNLKLGGLSSSYEVSVHENIVKIYDGHNSPEYLEFDVEERILYRYYNSYSQGGYVVEEIPFDKLFGENSNGEFLFDADSYEFSEEKGCYVLKEEFIPDGVGIVNVSVSFVGESVFFAIDTIYENGDMSFFSVEFTSFGETEEIVLPEI